MISNNYKNYGTRNLMFTGTFDSKSLSKLKKAASDEIGKCIDSRCKEIEEWTDKASVISIQNEGNKLSRFVLTNDTFGTKSIGLSFPKKDNELIHSFLSITKDMLLSAEQYIKNFGSN
jgi:hypothetical protein